MHTLKESDNFVNKFIETTKVCWENSAVSNYGSAPATYAQLASRIETNMLLWQAAGLKQGDKIAINSKSCAEWLDIFFATQIGGYVSVQIFPKFTPADIENMLQHSESRIAYTEKAIFETLNTSVLPNVIAFIDCQTGELLFARENFAELYNNKQALFEKFYPQGLTPETLAWKAQPLDNIASIMYTSGSTGNPKGVVLMNRNFSANMYIVPRHNLPYYKGENYVSVLPYTHIFGLTYDMIAPVCYGLHLVVLGLPPVPTFLKPALREFRPRVFFVVPLILTKLIDDAVGEFINSKSGKAKLAKYKENEAFCEALSTILMTTLGGNIELFATGGAAIPEHFERLCVEQLGLPFITGYGMTEAAPVISLGHKGKYKLHECGEYVDEVVELKIDSPNPATIPGEILIRGHVVFKGYYKNPEATAEAFTPDGWFHTGDMATIDSDNSIFIVGRCKNMILTPNGQNIYPEEIEVVLNSCEGVAESIIVSRADRLVALIVPDAEKLNDMDAEGMQNLMKININTLNKQIPSYCQVSSFEINFEPFAKTPKGSIKRFMYK